MFNFLFGRGREKAAAVSTPTSVSAALPRPAAISSLTRNGQRFAVIDTETTGVYVHRDRLVEIAIVQFDADGTVIDEYCTLVNPERDLGPTNIHGVSAADARLAPKFREIGGDVLSRLRDVWIVGHNVWFDWQVITAEFERIGISLPSRPLLCTMQLASRYGLKSRKLIDCCVNLGINPGQSHSALHDAKSSLLLFRHFREKESCRQLIEEKQKQRFPEETDWPAVPCFGKSFRRRSIADRQPHYLKDLIACLPDAGSSDSAVYASALGRALEDRAVTEAESNELAAIAAHTGLSKDAVIQAHIQCLRELIVAALADGSVSIAERADLDTVACLIGIDVSMLEELIVSASRIPNLNFAPRLTEFAGKRVCFTGTLTSTINGQLISREVALQLSEERGLIPTDSLTKKTDILVLADPDSMSGKANKARAYGTRLMTDRVFWRSIGVAID